MRCQQTSPSLIFAAAVTPGGPSYSRVTTGPLTMISPMVPGGSSLADASVGMGSSVIAMIFTRTPATGLPTQAPGDDSSDSSSPASMEETGRDSVAPSGL